MNDSLLNSEIQIKKRAIFRSSLMLWVSIFIFFIIISTDKFGGAFLGYGVALFISAATYQIRLKLAGIPLNVDNSYRRKHIYPYDSSDGSNPASPAYMGNKWR
jgi:hypothetical protein